jgi:hypothetical protein
MADHVGLDLAAVARPAARSVPELNIISGVTVTIMVIDDSIVRSGIRVARALGLGGLDRRAADRPALRTRTRRRAAATGSPWSATARCGGCRWMWVRSTTPLPRWTTRAPRRPLTEPPPTTFIDMYATALVSHPSDRQSLLGPRDHATCGLAGRGRACDPDRRAGHVFLQGVGLCARRAVRPDRADPGRPRSASATATTAGWVAGRRRAAPGRDSTCSASPPMRVSTRPNPGGCNCWSTATWPRWSGLHHLRTGLPDAAHFLSEIARPVAVAGCRSTMPRPNAPRRWP